MANIIKIKRGTGISTLTDGELGFNTLTNTLYIGNGGNKILGGRASGRNLLACLPLSRLPFGTGDSSGTKDDNNNPLIGEVSYDPGSESLHIINDNSNTRLWLRSNMPVQQGETYVVSCWAASAVEDPTRGEEYQFQISYKKSTTDSNSFGNTDRNSGNFYSFLHKDTLNTGWTWRVIYQIFTVPANANFASIAFRTGFDFQKYTNIFFVKNFKIEQGSVYTEWCPAPEELLTYAGGNTYESLQVGTGKSRHLNLWAGDDGVTKIGHQDASWLETNAIYLYDTHTYFKKPLQIISEQFWESSGDGNKYGIDMRNSDIMNANGIYFQDDANAAGEGLNFARGTNTWDSLLASGGKLYFAPNRANNSVGTRYEVYHAGGATIPVSKGGTGVTTETDLRNLVHNSYNGSSIANTVDIFTLAPGVYHLEETSSTDKNYPIAESRATIFVYGQFRAGTAAADGYPNGYWVIRIFYGSGKEYINFRYWSNWKGWQQVHNGFNAVPVDKGGTGATTAAGALTNLGALSKSGSTIDSQAFFAWADAGHFNQSGVSYPYKYGGLKWSGESDGVDLFAEETGSDNLDLIIQFRDDNSNGLQIRNSTGGNTFRVDANGCVSLNGYVASGDNMYATYMVARRDNSTSEAACVARNNNGEVKLSVENSRGIWDTTGGKWVLSAAPGSTNWYTNLYKAEASYEFYAHNSSQSGHFRGGVYSEGGYWEVKSKTGIYSYQFDAYQDTGWRLYAWNNTTNKYDADITFDATKNRLIAHRLRLTSTADALETQTGDVALTIGPEDGQHLIIDTNEILSKTNATTTGDLYLQGLQIQHSGKIVAGTWNASAIGIGHGGTGATSASGARANLGALSNAGDTANGNYTLNGSLLIQNTSTQKIALNNTNANSESSIGFCNAGTLKWVCGIGCGGSGNTFALWNANLNRNDITVDNTNGQTTFTGAILAKNAYSGYAKIWSDNEGGNIQIGSKSGNYHYQWDAHQDNHMRFFVQGESGSVLASWNYWPHSGCFTTKAININNTGDITGITYSGSAPAGSAGHIWLKPI